MGMFENHAIIRRKIGFEEYPEIMAV